MKKTSDRREEARPADDLEGQEGHPDGEQSGPRGQIIIKGKREQTLLSNSWLAERKLKAKNEEPRRLNSPKNDSQIKAHHPRDRIRAGGTKDRVKWGPIDHHLRAGFKQMRELEQPQLNLEHQLEKDKTDL